MGVREVVFECDSNIIYDTTIGVNDPLAAIADIIEGVRHKFHEFQQVLVNHIKRKIYRSAHILAKQSTC